MTDIRIIRIYKEAISLSAKAIGPRSSETSSETTGELMIGPLPWKSIIKVDRRVFRTHSSSFKMLKAWSVKSDKVGMF